MQVLNCVWCREFNREATKAWVKLSRQKKKVDCELARETRSNILNQLTAFKFRTLRKLWIIILGPHIHNSYFYKILHLICSNWKPKDKGLQNYNFTVMVLCMGLKFHILLEKGGHGWGCFDEKYCKCFLTEYRWSNRMHHKVAYWGNSWNLISLKAPQHNWSHFPIWEARSTPVQHVKQIGQYSPCHSLTYGKYRCRKQV